MSVKHPSTIVGRDIVDGKVLEQVDKHYANEGAIKKPEFPQVRYFLIFSERHSLNRLGFLLRGLI